MASSDTDLEKMAGSEYAHLTNTSVRSFSWENITVTVKDRHTRQPKDILSDVNGFVKAGSCRLWTPLHTFFILTRQHRRNACPDGTKVSLIHAGYY